jgi:pentatricopeptide repeat protein
MSLIHQHIAFGPRARARPWELKTLPPPRQVQVAQQQDIPVPGFVKPLRGRSTSAGLPLKRRPHIPTENAADLEALADKLEQEAERTVHLPRKYLLQNLRSRLLSILANTQEASSAWAAYRALLVLPRSADKVRHKVPFAHRHRLLRLLAAAQPRPRARGRYAQVLAVLRALLQAGGTVKLWEWNLLLDCAGKEGWRRPREEHFRVALALIAQMRRDPPTSVAAAAAAHHPGSSSPATNAGSGGGGLRDEGDTAPDIFSYTTLLAHAVRTRAPAAVRHAAQLLTRSGFALGVHAHTTLLCYFARRGDLAGVRDTLFRMRRQEQGGGLTQTAFNIVLWAFAYNGRLDVARAMYRVIGGGGGGSEEEGGEIEELKNALAEREMIVVGGPEVVVPDIATYHILIQAYAYHGDLRACLETLTDMLSAKGEEGMDINSNSLTAFRAIFLGFARHGVFVSPPSISITTSPTTLNRHQPLPISQRRHHPTLTSSTTPSSSMVLAGNNSSRSRSNEEQEQEWTLTTLEALFTRFLELPPDTRLRENVLFWLISAFARTSGHDSLVLRDVFERLESRFGCGGGEGVGGLRGWSGRLARIREKVFSS